MTRFHLNAHGEPAPCSAQPGNCPLDSEHFNDEQSAREHFEAERPQNSTLSKSSRKAKVSIPVYHGSPVKFEEFDYSSIGANGTSEGQGFYFTDSVETASHYGDGGYLYEVDFHGEKSLSSDSLTISKTDYRNLLEIAHQDSEYLDNWGDVEEEGYNTVLDRAVENEYYPGSNDVDLVGSLINSSGSSRRIYRRLYEEHGFDHIKTRADWGDQTIYVATVPEAFTLKSVSETPKSE